MSTEANRIVQKLWSYCTVLRDDGLSYGDYLEQLSVLLRAGISFAFETTLAGKGHAHRIQQWQLQGYSVKLVFLQLQSVDQGHAIRHEVIARRFRAGLHNFETLYRPLVNEWQTIDNGGPVPLLLNEGGDP